MSAAPPVTDVEWRPAWRIVPSRYPPIPLFERVADPRDLEAVFAIESMTNPRLRDEAGDIALVAPEDRISGPGTSVIMAAFTHLNPEGTRFSDGSFGVCYTADRLETAVAETRHHRERFMRATAQPRMELSMRAYRINLSGALHDLRGRRETFAPVYDPDSYAAGQRLGGALRAAGSGGIVYHSVREPGGECAAVFRPRLLSNCRQGPHLCYAWDGQHIDAVYRKRRLPRRSP